MEQGLERARLRGRATRPPPHLDPHPMDEAVCAAEVSSGSPREVLALLHCAMRTRGLTTPRGSYTLSTSRDERDLDGTGQAFAESLKELRRAVAVHRGGLPRAAALAAPGRPKKSKMGRATSCYRFRQYIYSHTKKTPNARGCTWEAWSWDSASPTGQTR